MNLNYQKWFTSEITNSYFPKGRMKFKVFPLKETFRLMNNYEIKIKKEAIGFSLYAGVDHSLEFKIEELLKGLDNLYFQLLINDEFFFNYTDIPFLNQGEVFYFKNGINANASTQMQKQAFVSNQDLIEFQTKQFDILLPKGASKLEIKADTELVFEEELDGDLMNSYTVNLTAYEDGIYEVWLNDKLQKTIFCTEEHIHEDCKAIIRLDIQNIITEFQNEQPYRLSFNARSVFWQYQVVVPSNRKIEVLDMSVVGSNLEDYQGPVEKQLVGGQLAQVFTTPSPIPLQYHLESHPQLLMTYSNDFSNRKNQLEMNLPNPEIEQIRQYIPEEYKEDYKDEFISSIIVHV